jgi:hypothetical protein
MPPPNPAVRNSEPKVWKKMTTQMTTPTMLSTPARAMRVAVPTERA